MKALGLVRITGKPRSILVLCLAASGLAAPGAFAAPEPLPPCSAHSESRQLDFWLGEWNITCPGAPGGSTSKVSPALDHCEIVES